MGLKLVHSIENQEAKPRVFVVAEQSTYDMLCKDLAIDVYPVCFDYASFMQASLTKSISLNNAVVLVSDSLSQKLVPLEAVIALSKENMILIPWQMSEEDVIKLNIGVASRRPTLNTLRRTIFHHIGLNEPPARHDGDNNLDVPSNAAVVEFVSNEEQNAKARMNDMKARVHANNFEVLRAKAIEPLSETVEANEVLPQSQLLLEAQVLIDPEVPVEVQEVAQAPLPAEAPKQALFAELTQRDDVQPQTYETQTPEAVIGADPKSIYESRSEPDAAFSAFFEAPGEQKGMDSIFENDSSNGQVDEPTPAVQTVESEQSSKVVFETPIAIEHVTLTAPVVATPKSEFSLPEVPSFTSRNLFNDKKSQTLNNETFGSIFENKQSTKEKESEPLFAFGSHDANGNQNMWSMYESKDDLSDAKALSMNDLPALVDEKKQLYISEPLVVCVYSPKGGVGKTSISVNLAARLAYTTRAQVCIVDLDIGFGNVGTRLGLYNPTVRELLSENHLDSEALARNLVYDRRSGLFALLAPLRPETGTNRRKFSPATYNKILELLTQRFDIIILDCPVELRDPLVSGFALTSADKVVMVVNNEQATLLDARRALEAMCRSKESQRLPGLGIDPKSIGLIVNQKVDNVGREIEDVIQVISGADQDHPSRQVDVLAIIEDDRELWVGNANMARTVATSGENAVDVQLDHVWSKLLPEKVLGEIVVDDNHIGSSRNANQLDEIFSNKNAQAGAKHKRRFSIRKDRGAN